MKRIGLPLVTCLVAIASGARAQQPLVVSGRVFDDTTGCPLGNANIHVIGGPAQAMTNTQGRYRLTGLPTTSFVLEATHVGYQPARTLNMMPTDSSARADFSLIRAVGDSARPQAYPKARCHLEPRDSMPQRVVSGARPSAPPAGPVREPGRTRTG